jgi:hypothetical protein
MVAGQEFSAKSCSSRLQDMVATQGWSIDCSTDVCRTGNTTGLYQMVAGQEFSAMSCSSRLQDIVAAQKDAEQETPQGCNSNS